MRRGVGLAQFVRFADDTPAMTTVALLLASHAPSFEQLLDHPGGSELNVSWWKLFLAIAAIAALLYEAAREAEGRPVTRMWKRRTGAFFAFGAVVAYFQFFQIGYPEFYHRWEHFHYYMGSKYFREIGYEGIYTCTAVAEAELGFAKQVRARKLRDLRTDDIVSTGETLAQPEACKATFAPARWDAFKQDVAFFRQVSGSGTWWASMQEDHGYNPTPVWGLMGWVFSSLHPAAAWYQKFLSSLDIGLTAAAFGCVAWAFGWRVACVAVTFWGTQVAASGYWTLGAFLRQDWFAYTLIAACLARRRRFFGAGALLAYATLLRVFPMFLFGGWVVMALAYAYRQWRRGPAPPNWRALLHPQLLRAAAGALCAALVLVPASVAVAGPQAWPTFVRRIRAHANSPVTNNMGWRTIVGHAAEGRAAVTRDGRLREPFAKWKAARQERVAHLRVIYLGGIAAALGLFAYACWRLRAPWLGLALSCLPTMMCVEVTGYYFTYFVLGALLSRGRRQIELALMVASALSGIIFVTYRYTDDQNAAWSVLFLNLGLFLVLMYTRSPWRRPAAKPISAPAGA